MTTFECKRDALLLALDDDLIDEQEFLMYDLHASKNPNSPYNDYEKFDLDLIDPAECKASFTLRKTACLFSTMRWGFLRPSRADKGAFVIAWKGFVNFFVAMLIRVDI